MSNKIKHEEIKSHIRAFCVKQDLQKLFFSTNIKVYAFDSRPINKKDSIVVIAIKDQNEAAIAAAALLKYTEKNGENFRNIEVCALMRKMGTLVKY